MLQSAFFQMLKTGNCGALIDRMCSVNTVGRGKDCASRLLAAASWTAIAPQAVMSRTRGATKENLLQQI